MRPTPVPKRQLKNKVAKPIWQAISVIENVFGGYLSHDSGHNGKGAGGAPMWIFTFPRNGNAQLALRMNATKASMYMRARSVDAKEMEPLLQDWAVVEGRYTNGNSGVAASLLTDNAPFLNPSPANPLLRVKITSDDINPLLRTYLGELAESRTAREESPESTPSEVLPADPGANGTYPAPGRPMSAEELQIKLERQSELGRAGELFVVTDEVARLRRLGCVTPEAYVTRVAEVDVGRGYDIESTWPGNERCIEVKTSTGAGNSFYLTDNERRVLTSLGTRAWLYRVVLPNDSTGAVVHRVSNPMGKLAADAFVPVVFRVDAGALNGIARE